MASHVRLAFLVLLPATLALGCSTGATGRSQVPRTASETFTPMTSGRPDTRWSHLEQLDARFRTAEVIDTGTVRRNLLAYTDAVAATAESIVDDHSAPDSLRRKAAQEWIKALYRRLTAAPKDLGRYLDASDRIEDAFAGTDLVPVISFERIKGLGDAPEAAFDRPEERIERMTAATLRLAQATPSHPEAPMILSRMVTTNLERGQTEKARELLTLLVERYPESIQARFAVGALDRLDAKGTVLEDFRGPGLDGKPVDLEDHRGKIVLIPFWSTATMDSVGELARLGDLAGRYDPEDVQILGVCLDAGTSRARMLMNAGQFDWPNIHEPTDADELKPSPLALRFGIRDVPFVMVVDRQGRLVASGVRVKEIEPTVAELAQVKEDAASRDGDASPTKP